MTRDDRIRIIYRKRRRFARKDAAKVLGRSERWIEDNRFERERGRYLAWEEMVLLSYHLWTHSQIHRALGSMAVHALPRLSQLVELTVRIPRHKVIALRYQARKRGVDSSELVADSIDVYREEAEEIEKQWPDYMEAWQFPYTPAAVLDLDAEIAELRARGVIPPAKSRLR